MKFSKAALYFSLVMAIVLISSNYLVQFPFDYYGLKDILTWGAFTYPVSFLVSDLANRFFGKSFAREVVFLGFVIGIGLCFILRIYIPGRIIIASGIAYLAGELLDISVFDILRKKVWWLPPFASSILGSILDTVIFFSIAFYGTGMDWLILGVGDFSVKLFVDVVMLLPFRLAIIKYQKAHY